LFALVKDAGNGLGIDAIALMTPGVVDVGGDLGDLEAGECGYAGHGLVEVLAVDDELSFDTVLHEADDGFEVMVHVVGRIERGVYKAEAFAVFLMTVAAMLGVKLLAVNEVLLHLYGKAGGLMVSLRCAGKKGKECEYRTRNNEYRISKWIGEE
jgi:hypothetical protein